MTLDTTLPTLSLTSLNSGGHFQGGSSQNVTWTASDVNIASNPISISYSTNGSSYTAVASNIANSGTYAWTLPSINSATVTLRITATDLAGNVRTVTSGNFIIDISAPTISSMTITNNVTSITNRNILISLTI